MYLSEIYNELSKLNGVLDVVRAKITNKSTGNYSSTDFNINSNLFSESGVDFYSIDKRSESNLWASNKSRHQILDIRKNIESYFNFKFDLVVFMGMIGYGINNEFDFV